MIRMSILMVLLSVMGLNAQTVIPVAYNPPPALMADAGSDTNICQGCSVTLNGSATGGVTTYSYSWMPTSGLSNPSIANPVATPANTTTYTLTVTDDNNCTDTSEVEIIVGGVGIEEQFLNQLEISPNPANEIVKIDFTNDLPRSLQYEIIGIDGKLHQKGVFEEGLMKHQFDVSGFENGTYLLRLKAAGSVSVHQIVIKH